MATIKDVIELFSGAGVITVAIPFVLVFTIVYGMLSRLDLFGPDKKVNKRANLLISLSMGLASLALIDSTFMKVWSGVLTIGAVAVVFIMILAGFGGGFGSKFAKYVFVTVVVMGVLLGLDASGLTKKEGAMKLVGLILALGVIGLSFYFAFKAKSK